MLRVTLDIEKRTVSVGGKESVLPDKSFSVLSMLVEKAPAVIPRQEFIDRLWAGRQSTGEKGLTQSLWQIRSALGDESSQPKFIRTVPRSGYQWIGPCSRDGSNSFIQQGRFQAVAATLLVGVFSTTAWFSNSASTDVEYVGAETYMDQERRLAVKMQQGCMLYIVPAGDKVLSSPVLSEDRLSVAFQVRQGGRCEMATVQLNGLNRQIFGLCPSKMDVAGI